MGENWEVIQAWCLWNVTTGNKKCQLEHLAFPLAAAMYRLLWNLTMRSCGLHAQHTRSRLNLLKIQFPWRWDSSFPVPCSIFHRNHRASIWFKAIYFCCSRHVMNWQVRQIREITVCLGTSPHPEEEDSRLPRMNANNSICVFTFRLQSKSQKKWLSSHLLAKVAAHSRRPIFKNVWQEYMTYSPL